MKERNELLAKLLAMENVRVEYRKAQTAYFDLKTRTIVLPILKSDLSREVYDLFESHEIGHALETPMQGWHDAVTIDVKGLPNGGRNFKGFLNVVEDIRIERLIKNRYPGLRKSFHAGYKELLDNDFFGIANRDINDMLLIDRVNLAYKLGSLVNVKFSLEERQIVSKLDYISTWDQVVNISKELYNFCYKEFMDKEEQFFSKQEKEESSDQDYDFNDSFDDESEDNSDQNSDEDFDDASDEGQETDDSEEGENSEEEYKIFSGGEDFYYDDLESITDKVFREKEQTLLDPNSIPAKYVNIARLNSEEHIIPFKKILSLVRPYSYYNCGKNIQEQLTQAHKEFNEKNSNYINYIHREFEIRKSAATFSRAKTAKTGVLDPNKLYQYKFNDNMFRSMTIVPEGKNHGLLMFVDWSGSMIENMAGVLDQVMIMVKFCKKANIPFRVFGILSYSFDGDNSRSKEMMSSEKLFDDNGVTTLDVGNSFRLAEFFSDKMNRADYTKMSETICFFANCFRNNDGKISGDIGIPLSGTPLNNAIVLSRTIIEEFRKEYKLEMCNAMFLTDGMGYSLGLTPSRANPKIVYVDAVTKKEFPHVDLEKHRRIEGRDQMVALIKMVQAVTGTNLIGFFVAKQLPNDILDITDEMKSEFRTNKFVEVEMGFAPYYFVKNKAIEVNGDSLNVVEADKKSLLKAFKNNQNRKALNRMFLNKFVEKIS